MQAVLPQQSHPEVGHRAQGRRARSPLHSRPYSQVHAFGGRIHEAMPCQRLRTRCASLRVAAVALGLGAGSLLAQGSTGKIEGRVRDQAGAPIANAQVFVVGTAFNALTNPQGYYFINNVPAGTVAVRAAFIGYKSTQVDGVKVLAGQTITVDVQLEQTAVQIQEITVVTQTQPLVPRDEVTTKQRVDGEFADNLPVDRLNDVLALQPGVVASPTNGNALDPRRPQRRERHLHRRRAGPGRLPRRSTFAGSAGHRDQRSAPTPSKRPRSPPAPPRPSSATPVRRHLDRHQDRRQQVHRVALGYESDEPFGVNHSLGFNRFTGRLQRAARRRPDLLPVGRARGAAVDRGRHGQPASSPIFVPGGHRHRRWPVPDAPWASPTADTTLVPVYNVSRVVTRRLQPSSPAAANAGHRRATTGSTARASRLPQTARSTLSGLGQAQLLLRHRFAAQLHRPPQPEPGPHGPVTSASPPPATTS